MKDFRIIKAANILVNYSTRVRKGDYVQIVADYLAKDMALEVYKLVVKNGAYPILHIGLPGAAYYYYKYASERQLRHFPKIAMYEMKNADVVIYVGASSNTRELNSINPKKVIIRQKTVDPITQERLKKRWVLFEYPTDSLAQEADMSLEEFEKFVFDSVLVNWKKESKKLQKLASLLNKTNNVRIIGKNTDLSMSVRKRNAIVANGEFNMPDGEVFTAPVEKSVRGYISFDFPAIHGGREVENVKLEFKKGKCVKASAEKNENYLRQVLKTDKGASYVGELGIGMNTNIKRFVKNILFDEKRGKSIHIALGNAYPECKGKNRSAIHWDMIKDMRKGKIYFDDKVIYKDGKWKI